MMIYNKIKVCYFGIKKFGGKKIKSSDLIKTFQKKEGEGYLWGIYSRFISKKETENLWGSLIKKEMKNLWGIFFERAIYLNHSQN